ncbi:KamA family radical SAM protein [Candidatus Aenigmatarchaeota archaeon]
MALVKPLKYQQYSLANFRKIKQLKSLPEKRLKELEVVANVLPFKTNNYVINQLINWDKVPNDPLFTLNFPQKDLLHKRHFTQMEKLIKDNADPKKIKETADKIRLQLNPHPAGQMEYNVPKVDGKPLEGMQHKYEETALFFPSQGQTCHAYCLFCFRWAQFVGIEKLKFAAQETEKLVKYISKHPKITDILFTGGDPMIMNVEFLETYIRPLLESKLPNLKSIRIGTRSISYWPYRYLTDKDSKKVLKLFTDIIDSGKHLAIMAHFNHPRELDTPAVQAAIEKVRETGAIIRTQSPLVKHINDDSKLWVEMWKKQISLGCIPYYMFVARDTGAQHYFGVPLYKAWKIFKNAYEHVSGLARTVRGPSMSCESGKVQVVGVQNIKKQKVFVLRFLQGRNPDWVDRPFFAKFDPEAEWMSDLKPVFKDKFFFEDDYNAIVSKMKKNKTHTSDSFLHL